jgi:uncharacterized protein YjiS (DUF1127 family)
MAILNTSTDCPTSALPNSWTLSVLHRLASLGAMRRAVATRRQLAELDDRALKDIGISRLDAQAEASRAPWDLAFRRIG